MPQVSVPSAAKKPLNSHRYNPVTVGSLDWGEFLVTRRIECEKSDDWKTCRAKGFLRLAALDFPAYGRTFIKSAAFFVPYYQILEYFDGFRQNNVMDRGMACTMPIIFGDVIQEFIHTYATQLATLVATKAATDAFPSRDTYDIVYCGPTGTTSTYYFYKLNFRGKRVYKWFKSLGYDLIGYYRDTVYTNVSAKIPFVNAMSILCYAKIWADYFCNIHLYNSNPVVQLLNAIKHGDSFSVAGNTLYNAIAGELTILGIYYIWSETCVPFESSLYLNAWNSENSPIGSVSNDKPAPNGDSVVGPIISNTVLNSKSLGLAETANDVYISGKSTNIGLDMPFLTQYGINSLYAFFEFARRNNLFGSKSVQQAFARMGIKGNDWNSQFVTKLFEASDEIDFSAVMSNANTVDSQGGSYLGAYAGVGLCALDFSYNYKVSDYGMIINMSWLQVLPMQLHGFDPSVLRRKPFDWFSPEYDGKALRAIPNMEIEEHQNPSALTATVSQTVYGFCGIYDEMRTMRDEVLGDFCIGNAKNFLFARDFSVYFEDFRNTVAPQTLSIQYMGRYGAYSGLTDPFMYSHENGDRFYLQLKFEFEAERELLSNSDSLDLEGSETVQVNTDSNPNA